MPRKRKFIFVLSNVKSVMDMMCFVFIKKSNGIPNSHTVIKRRKLLIDDYYIIKDIRTSC